MLKRKPFSEYEFITFSEWFLVIASKELLPIF